MPQRCKTLGELKRERGLAPKSDYERRRAANPRLARSKKLRNSTSWQKFRRWFKKHHPLCCDPLAIHKQFNVAQETEQVHHVIGITERPDLLCAESNCRPLCTGCHGKVEGMERSGKATQHLFEDKTSEYEST